MAETLQNRRNRKKMNVMGNNKLPGMPGGTRHFSTGLSKVPSTHRVVRKDRFEGSQPWARAFNQYDDGLYDRTRNKVKRNRRRTSIKAPLMERNKVGYTDEVRAFIYDDGSNRRYNGTKHYQAGDGNWYVDDTYGNKQKLKVIMIKKRDL